MKNEIIMLLFITNYPSNTLPPDVVVVKIDSTR